MKELDGVLGAFHEATGCAAALWTRADDGVTMIVQAAAPSGMQPKWFAPPPATESPIEVETGAGRIVVAAIPGPGRAWLTVGPCPAKKKSALEPFLKFLLPVISQYLQSSLEVEHAATELADRYEEINLLYTISEILGRTVSLGEAAQKILAEVSETVGARRASILVHDRVTDTLTVIAALGVAALDAPPIAVDDERSVSARVFRTQHPMMVESRELQNEAESHYRRGAMLSVPIMWTGTNGSEPLGVVNLSDRRSGQPFSAGDQKLIAAIATQIGTAIQNARLVRAVLAQQKMVQEMELAHDLQMKLLPSTSAIAPDARVAARVIPAESVGGDFYNLFRVGTGEAGVMIGDVSSHGYRAALIMALAMSASTIHAQTTSDPGEMLNALYATLRAELDTTEMFITVFYAVIDRRRKLLRFANTGHPHAFIVRESGEIERLPAMEPPLGMSTEHPSVDSRVWSPETDLLVLFTDGVSDARDRSDRRLGEQRVLDTIRAHRAKEPEEILERVIELLDQHRGEVPPRDDLTMVVFKS